MLCGVYQPTFLYEILWNLGVAALVVWADRRFTLGGGRAFAVYVAGYTLGRTWIEMLRIDPANHFFGLRINVFTSIDRLPGRGAVPVSCGATSGGRTRRWCGVRPGGDPDEPAAPDPQRAARRGDAANPADFGAKSGPGDGEHDTTTPNVTMPRSDPVCPTNAPTGDRPRGRWCRVQPSSRPTEALVRLVPTRRVCGNFDADWAIVVPD